MTCGSVRVWWVALPVPELVARLVAVLELNTRLREVIETRAVELEAIRGQQAALIRRVEELERKAGKDSSNSATPGVSMTA